MIDNLTLLISRHQVGCVFGDEPAEKLRSLGVIAGLLAASQELLSPSDFARLVAACEIDEPTLAELLALATAEPETDPAEGDSNLPTIDV